MGGMSRIDKEKHHYLARTYLNGFRDGERVWCRRRDDGRVFAAHPRRVAARAGYYAVPEGWTDDRRVLENAFGEIEAAVSPFLRRAAVGPADPSLKEYEALLRFVAISYARVPGEREHQKRQYLNVVETSAKMMNTATGSQQPESGYSVEENTDISMLLTNADALLSWIDHLRPNFHFLAEPGLITSDRPVCLVYEPDHERTEAKKALFGPTYDPAKDICAPKRLRQVQMTLSARCALVLDAQEGPIVTRVSTEGGNVAMLNQQVAEQSTEVYGPSRDLVEAVTERIWTAPVA